MGNTQSDKSVRKTLNNVVCTPFFSSSLWFIAVRFCWKPKGLASLCDVRLIAAFVIPPRQGLDDELPMPPSTLVRKGSEAIVLSAIL